MWTVIKYYAKKYEKFQHKWINPLEPLRPKTLYYKEHFMRFSKLGFIIRPKYLRVAIGQLRVSSHQLEVENGRANGVPIEERMCILCYIEIEDEYHFRCKRPTYVEIREKYQDIFNRTLSHPLPLNMLHHNTFCTIQ